MLLCTKHFYEEKRGALDWNELCVDSDYTRTLAQDPSNCVAKHVTVELGCLSVSCGICMYFHVLTGKV
jgi:hypothetical protein